MEQGTHVAVPAENVPAWHFTHDVAPTVVVTVPELHSKHLSLPFTKAEYLPTGHNSHDIVPVENVPAEHDAHTVAPTALDTVPAWQSIHESVLLLENFPCGQYSQLTSEENLPGLQSVHDDDPEIDIAFPISHVVHVDAPELFHKSASSCNIYII